MDTNRRWWLFEEWLAGRYHPCGRGYLQLLGSMAEFLAVPRLFAAAVNTASVTLRSSIKKNSSVNEWRPSLRALVLILEANVVTILPTTVG